MSAASDGLAAIVDSARNVIRKRRFFIADLESKPDLEAFMGLTNSSVRRDAAISAIPTATE